ncbi:MAG TPA: hemolysin family protein [Bacillota bacterium]|nr:hemolysin family protein [Bacillota bacterium]
MTVYALLAGLLICLMLSALFSASEISYTSCNVIRLEHEAEDGNKRAAKALSIARRFDDTLSSILIGNNLVNISASSIASVLTILVLESDRYSWLSTLVVTVLVIIFGETIPKIVAKKNANRMALAFSGAIGFLIWIFRPVTLLVVALVRLITGPVETTEDEGETVEELQSIIEIAEGEGVLDSDRTQLVQAAIEFSDISAYEAMTARVDMLAIDIEDDWEDIVSIVNESPYSRLPVYEDSIDNIIGVLHLNHLLKAMLVREKPDIRELLMPPCYVYKTMKLPKVLSELQTMRQHLAVVTDEYSGTLGVITMEDVLEEIVGDIWDETDVVEEEIIKRSEQELEVDGDMSVFEFLELFDIDDELFEFESDTVGGWTVETLGYFPKPGDSFDFEDLKISVLSMDGLRVDRVLAHRSAPEEQSPPVG